MENPLIPAYNVAALSDQWCQAAAAVCNAPAEQIAQLRADRDEKRREYLQAFYAAYDQQREGLSKLSR